jgi:hypothetical protein
MDSPFIRILVSHSDLSDFNNYIKIIFTNLNEWFVVLYVCKTRSLILREERRLRVFENRVLRRIFGLKRDKITGE